MLFLTLFGVWYRLIDFFLFDFACFLINLFILGNVLNRTVIISSSRKLDFSDISSCFQFYLTDLVYFKYIWTDFFMLIKNTPFRNIFLVAKSAFISAYWKFISSFFSYTWGPISPSLINSSTYLYHTLITLILMLSAIVSSVDLIVFYF